MGKLIVIDGLDGSGKATTADLVVNELNKNNIKAIKISFPDYNSDSSALVKMYLNGEFGKNPNDVNAYTASTFYAVDRFASYKKNWKEKYENGYVIICDRYTTSNIIHQMSKLCDSEKQDYIDWLYDLEYNKLKLPRPDKVMYLDMSPVASQKLMLGRYKGDENKKDIHENNLDYLKKCRENALLAAKMLGWNIINMSKDDIPCTIEENFKKVYKEVLKIL